jgi:hypothetical protein
MEVGMSSSDDIRRAVLSRPLNEVRVFHRRWRAGLVYHPVVSAFLRENAPGIGMDYAGSMWPQIFVRQAAARQRRREQAEAAIRAELARRRQLAVRLLDATSAEDVERIVAEHGDDALAAFKAELERTARRWGELPLATCAFVAAGVLGVAHELRDEETRRDERAASARKFWLRAEEEDGHLFFH